MVKMKAERLRRGWSQQELGARARVPAPDVCRIEKGRLMPYEGQALRLAEALELTPSELFTEGSLQFVPQDFVEVRSK